MREKMCNPRSSIWVITILLFVKFHSTQILAQNTASTDSALSEPVAAVATRKLFGGKITNNGHGGLVLKFSHFNDQFAFMTGGRGAATINNRYTIGGGGYSPSTFGLHTGVHSF